MNCLREKRLGKKLTQCELAIKTGVTPRYIAFIESGDRTPSLETAYRIAKVLNVSIEQIFLTKKCT